MKLGGMEFFHKRWGDFWMAKNLYDNVVQWNSSGNAYFLCNVNIVAGGGGGDNFGNSCSSLFQWKWWYPWRSVCFFCFVFLFYGHQIWWEEPLTITQCIVAIKGHVGVSWGQVGVLSNGLWPPNLVGRTPDWSVM